MNALISGSTGLIGSAFLEKYGSVFEHVFTIGRKASKNSNHFFYDFSKPETITFPEKIDVFFHFASQTSIDGANQDIENDLRTNVSGFVHLLEIFRDLGMRPVIIIASTATQVGYTNSTIPHDADHPDNPITFYDISKLTAEKYLLTYAKDGWLKGCSLRLCNVFGGSSNYGAKDRGIIDKVFMKAVNGEKISFYDDGNFVRDYIYIQDVISAFWEAFDNINLTNQRVFYIGTGKGISIKDAFILAQNIASEIQPNQYPILSIPEPKPSSIMNSRSFVSDPSDFCKLTNWKPKYNLELGLRDCYKKILSQKNEK
jgi:nucleoside-diphosphate-sugar epimerase